MEEEVEEEEGNIPCDEEDLAEDAPVVLNLRKGIWPKRPEVRGLKSVSETLKLTSHHRMH